ncbi:MAG TPA: ABC transporter substrate-binding protein, partial [Candidatus Ruania gallistercoris]|nr:ABC transporter substrate-binding protein [Candidatus Ruania gallistercoris]
MRRRTLLIGTAAGAGTALLVGCSDDGGTSGGGGDGELPDIAIVSKGFQHQFWQAVKTGAEQGAEGKATITFEGPATETDVEEQINMLQSAIARSPDAIALAALDSRAAEGLLQQAKSQQIPVIAFDSGVDSEVPLTTVSTDNTAAAAAAAEHMAELIGGEGTVAMVIHDQTSGSGQARRDGFIEWMEQNAPDIELLEPQYGDGDQNASANITKSILTSNPDLAGIYGSNEGSAIGVIKGVQESGMDGEVVIVGFDSGQAQIDAIESG